VTGRWTMRWGSGCGCGCCIDRWHRWRLKGVASLGHTTSGRSRLPRRLAPWCIGCVCQPRIHDVFHVGLLKKFFNEPPQAPPALPPLHHGHVYVEPKQVPKCCLARGQRELLVRWKGMAAFEATWLPLEEFRCVYQLSSLRTSC
jgi:hypothetical protein